MHPDKDLKLEQGSRSHARETQAPVIQNLDIIPVGNGSTGKLLLYIDDVDIGVLYLTADAPQMYHEVMKHIDADGWVKAIAVEYENLCRRGVFDEVKAPPDVCVHDGHLVFTEKISSEGEVTRKKVRLVAKGYMEI